MTTVKLIVVSCLLLVFANCDKKNDLPMQTVYGKAVALGKDSVRSFVTLDASGNSQTIGIQFGENALNGLPTDTMPGMPGYMFPLEVPAQAKATGVDHLEMDWNPFGHEPKAIYGVPHFDFHFYYVTQQQLAAVTPGPDTVTVPAQFIPKNYVSGVIAVPYMGVHWIDTTSAEWTGSPFTATFIYGFYHGELTFVEPMITKAFLEAHTNISAPIKQPPAFQKSNAYPSAYQLNYNAAKHVYAVTISGLIKHV